MKQVILGVGAHPDDLEFTASGTIAKFVAEGGECYYLICTDGSRGSSDPKMTHERLSKIRKAEQRNAGKSLGLKDVLFLNHTDTQLVADMVLKEEIVEVIKKTKPDIVITWDPTFYYSKTTLFGNTFPHFINHTDHRAAGLATMDAVFPLSRDRLTFLEHLAEGLEPHHVKELWFVAFEKGDHIVDITRTFDKKIQALACHKSQFTDFPAVRERVTKRAIAYAEDKEFLYGEAFVRLILPGSV